MKQGKIKVIQRMSGDELIKWVINNIAVKRVILPKIFRDEKDR